MTEFNPAQAAVPGKPDTLNLEEVQEIKADLWGSPAGGAEAVGQARPQLVAEGDSWFDYPPGLDILDHLKRTHKYPITKLSKAGDTLENMVYGTGFNRDFSRLPSPFGSLVNTVARQQPAAVLFSAGGNDVAGDDLAAFLNHKASGRPVLRTEYLSDVIGGFVREAYRLAAKEVWKAAPNALFVTHGYGYAVPDGKAVLNFPFGFRFIGPWLRPAFARKGVEVPEGRDIIRVIIDKFNDTLGELGAELGSRFVYIDLRALLQDADWVNELHVSSEAYGRVAAEFAKRLPK